MTTVDTIYALSSGAIPAGVAVVRVSGPAVRFVIETMAGVVPPARTASLRPLQSPRDGAMIDRGLVLYFPGPNSFTGEDVAEFQLHGGRAVVATFLEALASLPGLVPAEAGAFTRRAFENGRMDMTAVEGLSDLIAAETEAQRRQALRLAEGDFARRAEAWRSELLGARAAIEADLDFSDEEDVPGSVVDLAVGAAERVLVDMRRVLADGRRGERTRDGFHVAILGHPNAGKSSLMNWLAGRDVAIVTEVPGTTRDAIEVHLDLGGQAVILVDTAGVRETEDRVEAEGIRRALARARSADLVLWLDEMGAAPPDLGLPRPAIPVRTKLDAVSNVPVMFQTFDGVEFPTGLSVHSGAGLDSLVEALSHVAAGATGGEPSLITRARQRRCVEEAVADLDVFLSAMDAPLEVRAESLRRAGDAVGRLTGRIDVEEVLGSIFSSFCIGK